MLLLQSKKMSRSHSAKQQRMKNDEQNYVYIFLYTTYICFVVGSFCVVRDSESQFCTECVRWAFFVWRSINGGRNFRSDSSMPSLLSIWHAMCFANGAQVRSCTTTTVIAYMLILQSIACMSDVGIFFFSKFEMTPFGCGCRSENGLLRGMLHIMHCILSDAQKCNALHGSSLHSLGDSKGNCRFWIMCGVSSRKFQSMATTTIFCFTYSIDVTSLTSYNSQI